MNTKDFVFSASSVREYMQCGLKFKYGRIDKRERTETASHHRWFGSLIHDCVYAGVAVHESDKGLVMRDEPDVKYALSMFDVLWNGSTTNDDGEVVLKSFDDPVLDIVNKSLGEKPIGSFMTGKLVSLGSNDPDISQEDLEKGWYKVGKKMVKNGVKIVGAIEGIVELEYKMEWDFLGRKFVGYSDIVAKNPETGQYEYYDLKTSWQKPNEKYLKDDLQFFLYSTAIKDKLLSEEDDYYPTGNFIHLRSGEVIPYNLDDTLYKKMKNKTKSAFDFMEADIFPDDYGGYLCPYCDFRHICYGEDEDVWR